MIERSHLALIATVTLSAVIVCLTVLATSSALASVTGKPIPSPGEDWVIDVDTSVEDENINLDGNLTVVPGYSFSMKRSVLVMGSTFPGEFGVSVGNTTDTGNILIERTTVRAEDPDNGWTFDINGEATLRSSKFTGVLDGLRIFEDPVEIEDCEISASGTHGIYIEGASPNITSTKITLSTADSGCGMEVWGSSGDPSKPNLRDLVVSVSAYSAVEVSSSSYTFAFSLLGVRAEGADLGTLMDMEVILSEEIVANLTNSGTPVFNIHFVAIGVELQGSSVITGFDNVSVRSAKNHATVNYLGTNSATLKTWNSIVGLSNEIDQDGGSPGEVSGLVISDHVVTTTLGGSFSKHTHTVDGQAIVWSPDPLSCDGDDLELTDLVLSNLEADEVLIIDDMWNLKVTLCTVSDCTMATGFLVANPWTHDLEVSECTFDRNLVGDHEGDLIYVKRISGGLNLTKNTFSGNYLGMALYADAPQGRVWIMDNVFEANNHSAHLLYLEALGVLAYNPLAIEGNMFSNNSSPDTSHGIIMTEYIRQNLTVNNNFFHNNTCKGIIVKTPYSDYSTFPRPDFWFVVEDNEFSDMESASIYFLNVDNSHIVVRRNNATGGAHYCLGIDMGGVSFSVSRHWGSFQMYAQGPDSILVEDNHFTHNPGGGIFIRSSKYDPGQPDRSGNPYQTVTVRNNDLSYNGPSGWCLQIMGLYNRPYISGNNVDGGYDGMKFEIIEDEEKRSFFVMSFDGLAMDGDDLGRTALRFDGVGAILTNCSFTNYLHAIEVYSGAEVNVLWSEITMGSGLASSGSITVYNHLELEVLWSDASNINSGVPAVNAAVSLITNDGLPIRAATTDNNGRTPPTVVKVWEVVNGQYRPHSPLKVAISTQGEFTESWFELSRERTGTDAARVTLLDRHVPILTISSPQQNSVLPSSSVLLKGIVADFGSGIEAFIGRHDGMAPDTWVQVTRTTLWDHLFEGLDDGPHEFTFRVSDKAGNVNETTVQLTVDTAVPLLSIEPTLLDGTEIPYNEDIEGYYVAQGTVLIQGSYEDGVTSLEEITIRLDGRTVTALGGVLGEINIRVELDEGVNLLMFDAIDLAGNLASVKLKIVLDHSSPILYVYKPTDGLETRHPNITISGLTEPSMRLVFKVESVLGTRVYDQIETPDGPAPILAGEDGSFSIGVELFEGSQVLLITAEDKSGNIGEVVLSVDLDTEPPEFVLTSPDAQETVTNALTWTIRGSMSMDIAATILINGQRIENPGTFDHVLVLHEGVNEIEVIAIDSVGNTFREVRTIIRDTVPPVLVLTSPEGDDIFIEDLNVEFHGHVTGVASVLGGKAGVFVIKGGQEEAADLVTGTWDDGGWEYILTLGTGELDQEVTVIALDEAGNEAQRTVRLRYDAIPPSLSLGATPDVTDTPILAINGSTDEDVSTVWIQGIPYPITDGTINVQWFLVKGENSILVEVRDAAGNAQQETIVVTLNWEESPGPVTEEESEDGGTGEAYAMAFIVAGLVALVLAVILAPMLRGGDDR